MTTKTAVTPDSCSRPYSRTPLTSRLLSLPAIGPRHCALAAIVEDPAILLTPVIDHVHARPGGNVRPSCLASTHSNAHSRALVIAIPTAVNIPFS